MDTRDKRMINIDQPTEWIHLTTGKEFSRLLYTNPVCFLCTVDRNINAATRESEMASDNATCRKSNFGSSELDTTNYQKSPTKQNVMVLSWLTPTNNEGRFMFSINKHRYSASLLAPSAVNGNSSIADNDNAETEFSLCVPVKGMEELVLDVGSISGRYGSKFQSSLSYENQEILYKDNKQLSNRKRKKLKQDHLSINGVPGLMPVSLGCSSPTAESIATGSPDVFAIQGTVAHLRCRIIALLITANEQSSSCPKDNDHLLMLAEVVDAHVQSSYWDRKKLLFRSQGNEPPYLTFFGSQTFGYVAAAPKQN